MSEQNYRDNNEKKEIIKQQQIQTQIQVEEKNTYKHFPSSTREWNNSIYVYNKNALNLIPVASLSATKIIKSYFLSFNSNLERNIRTRKLRIRFRKLSLNKIFIGNSEFKHTNNKVVVNLYLFNRERKNYSIVLKKRYNFWGKRNRRVWTKMHTKEKEKILTWKKATKMFYFIIKRVNSILELITIRYNLKKYRLIMDIKYNPLNVKLKLRSIKLLYLKELNNLLKKRNTKTAKPLNKKRKYFDKQLNKAVFQLQKKYWLNFYYFLNRLNINHISSLSIVEIENKLEFAFNKYKREFRKHSINKILLYYYYKQLISINKSKFNYSYLQYLKKHLENLFNKDIEFNLINLKRFYLNSDILSESVKLKITRNRRRLFRHLSKLKNKVKIKEKLFYVNSTISKNVSKNILNQEKNSIKKNIIKDIKHKNVTGFRIEAKGRLTRRHTASRSVTKVRYKGNLLNADSSFKGLSAIILKGNLEANLQYTKSKSKTRIGSYGLKTWVSGN